MGSTFLCAAVVVLVMGACVVVVRRALRRERPVLDERTAHLLSLTCDVCGREQTEVDRAHGCRGCKADGRSES